MRSLRVHLRPQSVHAGAASGPAGPVLETLRIAVPPASFETGDNSSRLGTAGSTLSGVHILLVGRDGVPNRYLWFSHDDGTGRFTGVDPGDFETDLLAIDGIEVPLPAGTRTAAQNAVSIQTALVPFADDYTVDVVDDDIDITGLIDAAACSTGNPYNARIATGERGPGRVLGMVHFRPGGTGGAGGSSGNITEARAARLLIPELPSGPCRIIGVAIQRSDTTLDPVRISLADGGTSDTSPVGATRMLDFGRMNGTGVAGWQTKMLLPSEVIEVDFSTWTRPWVVFKGSTTTTFYSLAIASAFIGNYAGGTGAMYRIAAAGNSADPTVAFEATIGSGSPGTFNFVPAIRIIVQLPNDDGSYSSDGSMERILGTRSPAASLPDTTPIGVMVSMGMRAPAIAGLRADRMEVAYGTCNASNLFRGALYLGGAAVSGVGAANGATLAWDAGQSPVVASDSWAVWDHPSGGVDVPSGSIMWGFIRDDSRQSTIRFDAGVISATTGGPEDPILGITDEGAIEYEMSGTGTPAVSDNPNHSVSNDVAYEPTIISDASDDLPGNTPGVRVRLRLAGVALQANP